MKFGLLYEMETPRPWNALSEYNTYWEALAQIEIMADRERFRSATATTRRPLCHLGGVLAYLWMLESEVRDLTVIVEGKTTGSSGAEIAGRLVRAA